MTAKAVLSNYLWLPRAEVEGEPPSFAPEWEHRIELLRTPEGRVMQQQIASMREQGLDDLVQDLTSQDHMLIKNWSAVGEKWWALCLGDQKKTRALVKRLGLALSDRRTEAPWDDALSESLKLVMDPRDAQRPAFEQWLSAGHGILHAAPAFGKTFVMIWLILTLRQRTMVLVHTDALAEQFITRFRHGSPVDEDDEDTEYTPVTNCVDVEAGLGKGLGREIIGRYRSPDKLYPVTVATWQSFISAGGRKALKTVGKEFGLVLCDEAHVFAAPKPAGVVNGFHAKRRSGVTATPKRKDKLDCALYDILGPITAKGVAAQLGITSFLVATGVKYKGAAFKRKSEWAHMLNFLCRQADRNDLIMKWVEHDVEQGRNLLVLSDRVKWCVEQAEYLRNECGIPAAAVTGGMSPQKRTDIINAMGDGKIRVICATQVFKLGIDIPVLDTLYATCPMNNQPLLQQMLGRIRRFYDGKQSPVFRLFVDEGHGLLYGCARATHKHLIAEGSDIIIVPQGRTPEQVMRGHVGGKAAEDGSLKRRKKSLRAAASRTPDSANKLFSDLADEARQAKRYKERMGHEPSV